MFRPVKIISGGQTGADIGGLVGAERVGIPTGGTASRNYLTEKGPQADVLKNRFGLVMHPAPDYKLRTMENINKADAVLIFAVQPDSAETVLTIDVCEKLKKPYYLVDPFLTGVETQVAAFIEKEKPKILNIAGNPESVSVRIASRVAAIITRIFAVDPMASPAGCINNLPSP